jgi:hypothetical protein
MKAPRKTNPKPIDWGAVAAASGAWRDSAVDEVTRATLKRWTSAHAEAYERVQKAKSRGEKVKATINYALALKKSEVELNDLGRIAKAMTDLIDSGTPLHREERRYISRVLRQLCSPEPTDQQRRGRANWHESDDAYFIKHYLRKICGLTALKAEQEVADYLGISLDTLRTRKRRAKEWRPANLP